MSSVLQISSKEAEKLRDYEPIELGGLKFLGATIVTLVLMVNATMVAEFVSSYFQGPLTEIIVFLSILAILSGIIINSVFSEVHLKWVDSYLARNVRGYLVRFFIPKNQNEFRWIANVVTSRDVPVYSESFTPLGAITIELRLGGWISFGGTRIFDDSQPIRQDHTLRNWCVRLFSINHLDNDVWVSVAYAHPAIHKKPEHVFLEIEHAIKMLAYALEHRLAFCRVLTEHFTALERLTVNDELKQNELAQIQAYLERVTGELVAAQSASELKDAEVKRLAAEVAELTGKLEHERDRRSVITNGLEQISARFDGAQRLKSRIEALEIWGLVLENIVAIHIDNKVMVEKDPPRNPFVISNMSSDLEFWQGELAVVNDKLAEARKREQNKRPRVKKSVA